MNSNLVSSLPATRVSRSRLFRGLSLVALLAALTGTLSAQTDPNAAGGRRRGGGGQPGDPNGGGGRGNFDPAQMQQQMMDRLRETIEVADDGEWKVITDRLAPVMELRRATQGGIGGGRGGPPGGGGDRGGGPGGRGGPRGGSPEADALRQAVTDKLPEAEIKSRLERVRDARKANEEKLAKAQEDLRAVLSVRQEAVLVMFGLLQ
ncbi:MAG: hypothetical protein RLZZ15_3581 [Verrucomicrobiota bacterium]|jgi:Spy/CpxP family protein refolding chaperone